MEQGMRYRVTTAIEAAQALTERLAGARTVLSNGHRS